MQKAERQQLILKTINSELIERQEQLVDLLNSNGLKVTQASISRDLDELNIVKSGGRYLVRSVNADKYADGIQSIVPVGENLLVVKCTPGFASAVAFMIDSLNSENIAGTIAGDDTIFIAVRNTNEQNAAIREISSLSGTN